MGIVYCAENICNGFRYIGVTIQTLELRKQGHIRAAYNPSNIGYNRPFMQALRNNSNLFKWYIIDESDSDKELKRLERLYIQKYKTYIGFDDCKGYNATLGGDGVSVYHEDVYRIDPKTYQIKEIYKGYSEILKKFNTKIHIACCCCFRRESAYGDVWYYKSDYLQYLEKGLIQDIDYRINKIYIIDEEKNILKKFLNFEELLDLYGIDFVNIFNNRSLNVCFAKDYYNNEYTKGLYTGKNQKIILQYSLNGDLINVFLSLHDAEKQTKVYRASIVEVCKGDKITAGGFQWRFIEDFISFKLPEVKAGRDNTIKKVSQYSIDGFYIQTFYSLIEAAKYIGISDSSGISKVCRGIKQTAYGYRWRYGDSKERLKL